MSKSNDWLLQHKKSVTSQLGEDGILEKIFDIMPSSDKWCVEFGAGDGKNLSNTYNLINNYGWSSIQIEGNPSLYRLLVDQHQNREDVVCVNKLIDFVGENRLDAVLSQTDIPSNFDLISIDVDGIDYHIWDSLQNYKPKVVVIEFNPTVPHYLAFIQARNASVNQGCSLLALQELGKKKGYELICSTDWNGIFVDKQYFDLFEIEDNSIWKMNQNYQYWTYVFQLYDGSIILGGMNKLMWHGIEVDFDTMREMIQVLEPEQRKYPGRL